MLLFMVFGEVFGEFEKFINIEIWSDYATKSYMKEKCEISRWLRGKNNNQQSFM